MEAYNHHGYNANNNVNNQYMYQQPAINCEVNNNQVNTTGYYLPTYGHTYRVHAGMTYHVPHITSNQYNANCVQNTNYNQYGDHTYQRQVQNYENSAVTVNNNNNNNLLPCQSTSDWNYSQCYEYYSNGCYSQCQFVNFVDIEDFM